MCGMTEVNMITKKLHIILIVKKPLTDTNIEFKKIIV